MCAWRAKRRVLKRGDGLGNVFFQLDRHGWHMALGLRKTSDCSESIGNRGHVAVGAIEEGSQETQVGRTKSRGDKGVSKLMESRR
jgi:hypothetical protein